MNSTKTTGCAALCGGTAGLVAGLLAFFLGASAGALAAPAATQQLQATVGPGRTISLRLPNAGNPPILKAGRYTIIVTDRSRRDNFHLLGHVNRKTGIAFVGKRRWTVTLTKGIYRYRSDAHPRSLLGSFQVS